MVFPAGTNNGFVADVPAEKFVLAQRRGLAEGVAPVGGVKAAEPVKIAELAGAGEGVAVDRAAGQRGFGLAHQPRDMPLQNPELTLVHQRRAAAPDLAAVDGDGDKPLSPPLRHGLHGEDNAVVVQNHALAFAGSAQLVFHILARHARPQRHKALAHGLVEHAGRPHRLIAGDDGEQVQQKLNAETVFHILISKGLSAGFIIDDADVLDALKLPEVDAVDAPGQQHRLAAGVEKHGRAVRAERHLETDRHEAAGGEFVDHAAEDFAHGSAEPLYGIAQALRLVAEAAHVRLRIFVDVAGGGGFDKRGQLGAVGAEAAVLHDIL